MIFTPKSRLYYNSLKFLKPIILFYLYWQKFWSKILKIQKIYKLWCVQICKLTQTDFLLEMFLRT